MPAPRRGSDGGAPAGDGELSPLAASGSESQLTGSCSVGGGGSTWPGLLVLMLLALGGRRPRACQGAVWTSKPW